MKMKGGIKVGVDVDNVVCDSARAFSDFFILDRIFSSRIIKDSWKEKIIENLVKIVSSDFACFFLKRAGRMREVMKPAKSRKFKDIMETMLINLKQIPNAKEVINDLHRKYDLFFITSREYSFDTKEITFKWFKKNKIKFNKNKFYFLKEKQKKIDIAKKLGIKIFIEDNAETASKLSKEGIKVYLFDYKWNRKIKNDSGIERIKNEKMQYWHMIKKLLLK